MSMAAATSAIKPARLTELVRTRCTIFQTSYNPTSQRTGAKYLRARLRGPSMVKYYPQEINISQLAKKFPQLGLVNYAEVQRLKDVQDRKKRGKGAPKKAKTKGSCHSSRCIVASLASVQRTAVVQAGSGSVCAYGILLCLLVVLDFYVDHETLDVSNMTSCRCKVQGSSVLAIFLPGLFGGLEQWICTRESYCLRDPKNSEV